MVSNHPTYIIGYYAALKLGLIIVQINPLYTSRELLEISHDADLNYILSEPDHLEKITNLQTTFSFRHIFSTEICEEFDHISSMISLMNKATPLQETCSVTAKEVEGVLYEHPDILEAAVVGLPDE
jgi:long-chain acyl-CoA synthetase